MQQGKANLNYVPFHETKAQCNDTDEACNLALDAQGGYPPQYVRSARVGPAWLSFKQWCKVLEMRSRGNNILDIAEAVDKNASQLRVYMDTYLNNVRIDDVGPLPSASSTDSQSTADTITDELFPLGNEVMVPQEGQPHPSFLSRSEQALVWKMFQQNETVRSMWEQLHKSRRKISQYINAYMRPRLLKLQAEEREAEDRIAGTSTYIAPLTNRIPRIHSSETAAAQTPPRLLREPSLHSIDEMDLELELISPLLLNPTEDVSNQSPKSSCGSADTTAIPESTSAEDSLFGDSPVVENHTGSPLVPLDPTHHKEEPAQPTSSKRKHDDDEVQAQPQRASKRLRHRSFP
jgi:hypothetical protein